MRFTILIILTIINSNLYSQVKDRELDFTIVTLLENEMDTNLCQVSGIGEVGETWETGKNLMVWLHSDKDTIWRSLDSMNNFNFGFIDPGKYFIKITFIKWSSSRPDLTVNIDSFNFKSGGVYFLQIRKGKFNKDSCCYAGKHFLLPIYFELGTNEMNEVSKMILKDLSTFIRKYNLKVEIGLHVDERFDEKWSSRDTCTTCTRAEKVKYYLVLLGIEPERIVAKGYQGRKPYFIHAKTEEQHQENRRAMVTILPDDK